MEHQQLWIRWRRIKQRVKAEGLALRQSRKGLEASSRARYEVRRWSIGMEKGRRVNAHYVFDAASAFRVRAIAVGRKQTRERGRACLVRYNKGRLMVSYLGQRSMFINWPCPWMSRANQRERETGLEVWRVGGCRGAGVDIVHWLCGWCREKGGGSAPKSCTRLGLGWCLLPPSTSKQIGHCSSAGCPERER
jgi:hypothetical protein